MANKIHKAYGETNATIGIDIDEYNYLLQAHAMLQMILNYKGYDASPVIDTAKRMLAELEEGAAVE